MMRRYSVAILLYLGAVVPASAVIPIAADGAIAPARYFDLHGKTLRFTPSRRGYVLAASKVKSPGDLGTRLGWPDFPREPKYPRSWSWRRSIPFGFPFGGSTWREVFVNSAGNLTFGRPEAELYQERETWPDGTMQALAGALNNRAAAGQEKMICALWGLKRVAKIAHSDNRVSRNIDCPQESDVFFHSQIRDQVARLKPYPKPWAQH